eukprot:COSAG01_NODE_6800_length_3493_cov_8.005009_2_plen_215_part_00
MGYADPTDLALLHPFVICMQWALQVLGIRLRAATLPDQNRIDVTVASAQHVVTVRVTSHPCATPCISYIYNRIYIQWNLSVSCEQKTIDALVQHSGQRSEPENKLQSCCLKHTLGDAGFTCARTLVYNDESVFVPLAQRGGDDIADGSTIGIDNFTRLACDDNGADNLTRRCISVWDASIRTFLDLRCPTTRFLMGMARLSRCITGGWRNWWRV